MAGGGGGEVRVGCLEPRLLRLLAAVLAGGGGGGAE